MANINAGDDVAIVDISHEEEWEEDPIVTEPSFDQKASLQIAWVILGIFSGVYLLAFVMGFCMLFKLKDATYDNSLEFVKFLVSSVLPLVALAVGYYLGDRANGKTA